MSSILNKVTTTAKKIYVTEGLAPPSIAQFKQVYKYTFDALKTSWKSSDATYDRLVKVTARQWLYYGLGAVQVLGFFAIGEAIGRGKFVGYPIYLPKHEEEHH